MDGPGQYCYPKTKAMINCYVAFACLCQYSYGLINCYKQNKMTISYLNYPLDESMDNSVPTLEDQPVLEISLDEEPSEAFVPKGEVRQPKIKDPTASTEKGVDSAVSPRATEEIVPVNASKTQTQPERESSPQNDGELTDLVSMCFIKPVIFISRWSTERLTLNGYVFYSRSKCR